MNQALLRFRRPPGSAQESCRLEVHVLVSKLNLPGDPGIHICVRVGCIILPKRFLFEVTKTSTRLGRRFRDPLESLALVLRISSEFLLSAV